MKSIKIFDNPKYRKQHYIGLGNGIFQLDSKYFLSISFEQEPELGEGTSPQNISQYPLEDILDKFNIFVSDFCRDINQQSKDKCYLELSALKKSDIEEASCLIGKHAYNKTIKENGTEAIILVIE